MKQIIYNTNTQELSNIYQNGYKVDGHQGIVKSPLILLNVIDNVTIPTYDNTTHYITNTFVIDEVNNEYRLEYTINAFTAEEIERKFVNSLDWKGLEDDLEKIELVDSAPEKFFERAITAGASSMGSTAYGLLLNCFGANQWHKRLGAALQMVKDNLPTPLTANELSQLNTILADNNFNITIV